LKADDSSYSGFAFHPGLGVQLAQGRIVPGLWALRFESEAVTLELPYRELELHSERGDDRLFFRHPGHPDWSVFTFDHGILEEPALTKHTPLRHQIAALQRRSVVRKAVIVTALFFVAFALASLLVTWFSGWAVRKLVAQVPASWEKNLGDQVFAELKTTERLREDPRLAARVRVATERLVKAVPQVQFQFHILDEEHPNAFALPGGHVLVNTALLQLLDRPEELAGVLAHELAHVTERHAFRKIVSSAGPYFAARLLVGDDSGMLTLLADSSQMLVRQSFSRDYEREADDGAWHLLLAANIDPRGLTDALKKLKAEEEKLGGNRFALQAFSSHPPTDERITRLEGRWQKLKRQDGFAPLLPEEK
jgi:predicted Zn-dependent protease